LVIKNKVSKTITNTEIDNKISFFLVTSIATFLTAKISKIKITPGSHSIPFLAKAAEIKIIDSPIIPEIFVSEKSMYNAKKRLLKRHSQNGQKHVQ